jgi:hypothetical protein
MRRSLAPVSGSLRSALPLSLLALAGMSCGGGDYAILIRVQGAPGDTQLLSVSATLDGKPAAAMDVPVQPAYFGIRLPAQSSGQLVVSVSALLGSDLCKSAAGTVSVNLGAGRAQELTVSLSALSTRLCSLYTQKTGEGDVSVSPTGTACGAGCQDFPAGTQLTVSFTPSGRSFGALVSTNAQTTCDGLNPCSFNINRRTQLSASFNPRLCTAGKWCWYNPLPQGNTLQSLAGTGPSDLWAVGTAGTTLHYDGQIWTLVPSGTQNNLNGVWALAPNDVWAVGEAGTLLHYDGSKWNPITPSPTTTNLRSVWGSAWNNLWAVGVMGTVLRYNGTAWSASPIPDVSANLSRVTGSDAANVWVVGSSGTVQRFDGGSWTPMTITGAATASLSDAWVGGPGEVWVVGTTSGGSCLNARWDGSRWDTTTTTTSCPGPLGVWGNGPRDVWTMTSVINQVQRNTTQNVAQSMTQAVYPPALYPNLPAPVPSAIWGTTAGEVWIGTADGNLLRRNGDTQTTLLSAPPSPGGAFFALAGTGAANDLVVVRDNGLSYRYDGRKLNALPSLGSPTIAYDAWAAPTGELFVGSPGGVLYRFAGNIWGSRLSPSTSSLYAVGGVSASEVYVGTGSGLVYRVDYSTGSFVRINPVAAFPAIQAIWLRSSSDGWVVGDMGLIARLGTGNAVQQTVAAASSTQLYGVGGPPAPSTHVWAVGVGGLILHYNGSTWTSRPSATTENLSGVAAFSETDVWFAGNNGTLRHWNGTTVESVPSGTRANLHKIWGTPTTGLWLAGDNGVLMRYQP